MRRKLFSILSVVIIFFTYLMISFNTSKWGSKVIEYLYDISIATPFILGGLGLLTAILGVKGSIRKILITVILVMMIYFLIPFIMSFGFNDP